MNRYTLTFFVFANAGSSLLKLISKPVKWVETQSEKHTWGLKMSGQGHCKSSLKVMDRFCKFQNDGHHITVKMNETMLFKDLLYLIQQTVKFKDMEKKIDLKNISKIKTPKPGRTEKWKRKFSVWVTRSNDKNKNDGSQVKHLVWRQDDEPEFAHSEYKISIE